MISQLHVKNYKALRDVTFNFTPFHVLIGPNDSGKSTVLEVIQLLSKMFDAVKSSGSGGHKDLGDMSECLSWGSDEQSFLLQVSSDQTPHPIAISCDPKRSSSHHTLLADSLIPMARDKTKQFNIAMNCIAPATVYSFRPCDLKTSTLASADAKLSSSGFGLPSVINQMIQTSRRSIAEVEQGLSEIFDYIDEIRLKPTNAANKAVSLSLEFSLKRNREVLSASQASDGLMMYLAFLTIVHLEDRPAILLVEEPENGIHPQRLKEVIAVLRKLTVRQPMTQVIATTHSPYLLDYLEPSEVTLCVRDEKLGVKATRLSESEIVQSELKYSKLGEIWTGLGDAIIAGQKTMDAP